LATVRDMPKHIVFAEGAVNGTELRDTRQASEGRLRLATKGDPASWSFRTSQVRRFECGITTRDCRIARFCRLHKLQVMESQSESGLERISCPVTFISAKLKETGHTRRVAGNRSASMPLRGSLWFEPLNQSSLIEIVFNP
jgi:hypothetical protein